MSNTNEIKNGAARLRELVEWMNGRPEEMNEDKSALDLLAEYNKNHHARYDCDGFVHTLPQLLNLRRWDKWDEEIIRTMAAFRTVTLDGRIIKRIK